MSNQYYDDLLQQFKFQQRPYIAIAQVLDSLHKDFLDFAAKQNRNKNNRNKNNKKQENSTEDKIKYPPISSSDVLSFDFTVLKANGYENESFRWMLGFNKQKFANILNNRHVFQTYADLVFSNTDKHKLDEHYCDVLKKGKDASEIEFLTAVFHLTYAFNIPNAFNVGLIHRANKTQLPNIKGSRLIDCNVFRAVSLLDANSTNLAGLPQLKILRSFKPGSQLSPEQYENLYKEPASQISAEQYEKLYKPFRPFYVDWMHTLLEGGIMAKVSHSHNYHLYFPIYDGVYPRHISLRGYLAVYLKSDIHFKIAEKYFEQRSTMVQNVINEAYLRGTHHSILDNFIYAKRQKNVPFTIDFWKDNLKRLHRWQNVDLLPNHKENALWRRDGQYCIISIDKLLKRKSIVNLVEENFIKTYSNLALRLELPCAVEELLQLNEKWLDPFLEKRMREIVNLLDDILQKRQLVRDDELIKNAARKSGVAAVMARNMAHNVGSHVLAKFARETDINIRMEKGGSFKQIATLMSYLRTRMDFLAALSTASTTLVTNLKLYRDAMSYFKPVEIDEEVITGQELLLDHISGIDDLKSEDIYIRFLKDGQEISLATSEPDPLFASPNGLLGAHALYIILENIIRNSAKHAFDPRFHKTLEINVEIKESEQYKDEGFLEVCVYDNLGNAETQPLSKCNEKCNLVDYLNDRITASILDDGSLRQVAWGVLEMKICAAYLRRISPEILDDNHEIPLLEAISQNGNLGYKFYLECPKELVIVDDKNLLNCSDDLKKQLRPKGVDVIDQVTFQSMLKDNLRHDFMVLVDPSKGVIDLVNKFRKALPIRILSTNISLGAFPYLPLGDLKDCIGKATDDPAELIFNVSHRFILHKQKNVRLLIRHFQDNICQKWQLEGISGTERDTSAIEKLDPDYRYVVYDRHGEIFRSNTKNQHTLNQKFQNKQILYYEVVEHSEPTCFVVDYAVEQNFRIQKTALRMIETGLTKIAFLDERVQGILGNTEGTFNEEKQLLKYKNIIAPSKGFINLDNPRNYCKEIRQWMKTHFSNVDFLVIHYGILEKIYEDDEKRIALELKKFENKYPNINLTITSGRGLPPALQTLNIRFIHYSQIARYLLEDKSKYHLCKILYAARRSV